LKIVLEKYSIIKRMDSGKTERNVVFSLFLTAEFPKNLNAAIGRRKHVVIEQFKENPLRTRDVQQGSTL
jgi:hypothetical protein